MHPYLDVSLFLYRATPEECAAPGNGEKVLLRSPASRRRAIERWVRSGALPLQDRLARGMNRVATSRRRSRALPPPSRRCRARRLRLPRSRKSTARCESISTTAAFPRTPKLASRKRLTSPNIAPPAPAKTAARRPALRQSRLVHHALRGACRKRPGAGGARPKPPHPAHARGRQAAHRRGAPLRPRARRLHRDPNRRSGG